MERPDADTEGEKPLKPETAPPVPLSYQAPRDRLKSERADNPLLIIFVFFAGGFLTVFATVFASAYLFIGTNNVVGPRDASEATVDRWIAVAYFLCAAGIGVIVAKGTKYPSWRAAGRWFSLGTLLGAGIAMLIEGVCFAAQ
ncbi:MAG TPA: hypothetical protein VFC78_23260 [Tepidisphaeraceae bacterium]|nr:hypothetical protein [Tepidisphaeraceae bacterium]